MRKWLCLITLLLNYGICFAQQWQQLPFPDTLDLSNCSFISKDTGWVIVSNWPNKYIYKTTDGGAHWTSQSFPPDPPFDTRLFMSIHFIDANVGIIGCGNYLYAGVDTHSVSNILWTNDGGNLWEYKDLGNLYSFVQDAKLADSQTAYAIGSYGFVKKTTDGGTSWVDISYPGVYSGSELFPINHDTVFFTGCDLIFFSGGGFGKTANGGLNWNTDSVPNSLYMGRIFFHDYYKGWIGGYGGQIMTTNDAGINWTTSNSGTLAEITDIVFTDSLNGWAVTNSGEIIHSSDGGLNWIIEYTDTLPLGSISFPKPGNIGYAMGMNGRILKYSPLSVQALNSTSTLNVFPNPVAHQLNLVYSSSDECHFTLYDIFSRKVLQQEFTNSISLNTEQLGKGIYIYELRNKKEIIKKGKVVKQ